MNTPYAFVRPALPLAIVTLISCEMEISDSSPVSTNDCCVVGSDCTKRGSMGEKASLMLVEDPPLRTSLRHIVAGFTRNPVLQQDLMQESLLHLWKMECDKPGQTHSWYLQSCQFHVRHWLAAGRSMDSPKRAYEDKRITLDEGSSEAMLPEHHTNGELFETVSFRDVCSTLAKHLKPREQAVLRGLAEELAMAEIAAKFGSSYPTVVKYRRKIAALSIKLGISERRLPMKRAKGKDRHPECRNEESGAGIGPPE